MNLKEIAIELLGKYTVSEILNITGKAAETPEKEIPEKLESLAKEINAYREIIKNGKA